MYANILKENSMDNNKEDVLSCGCGHCHTHEERSKTTENTSFVKTNWLVFCRIIISVILLVVGQIFLSINPYIPN